MRSGSAALKNRAERFRPSSTICRMRVAASQSCGSCWLFLTVSACGPALSRPSAQGALRNRARAVRMSSGDRMSGRVSSIVWADRQGLSAEKPPGLRGAAVVTWVRNQNFRLAVTCRLRPAPGM